MIDHQGHVLEWICQEHSAYQNFPSVSNKRIPEKSIGPMSLLFILLRFYYYNLPTHTLSGFHGYLNLTGFQRFCLIRGNAAT